MLLFESWRYYSAVLFSRPSRSVSEERGDRAVLSDSTSCGK